MASTIMDMATRLADQGLGVVEVDIFPGRRPDGPDTLLAVQTYPGPPPELLGPDNLPAVEPVAFQLLARAGRGRQHEAEELASRAFRALVGRHLVINGRNYDWILANHMPASIGVDENDRPLIVVNMQARRRGTF